jgi:hypothetical protein
VIFDDLGETTPLVNFSSYSNINRRMLISPVDFCPVMYKNDSTVHNDLYIRPLFSSNSLMPFRLKYAFLALLATTLSVHGEVHTVHFDNK